MTITIDGIVICLKRKRLGLERYLSIKIQKGYSLWDRDKNDLLEILNK